MRCFRPIGLLVLVAGFLFCGSLVFAADGEEGATRIFAMVFHVAKADREASREQITGLVQTANDHFAVAGVGFVVISHNDLPESFQIMETIRERHRVKKYLVPKTINVFLVDEILDPNPSRATRKAAAWQGRKPSGRLSGAHIPAPGRTPDTYIILGGRTRDTSLTHELGHFFGLPHHRNPVNIMSYGRERSEFSEKQLKVVRRTAGKLKRKRLVRLVPAPAETAP